MAHPAGAVPSTLDTQYHPTIEAESGGPLERYLLYQSISMQDTFKNYSPEELRLADQARLPAKPKIECQFEKELKQRALLKASQKASDVDQINLQLQVEQFQQQLNPLKEKHRQEASKLGILQHKVTSFKEQVEKNTSEMVQLQAKVVQLTKEKKALEESMESTLKTRSEKMKTTLNKKLTESRDLIRAEFQAEQLSLVENARQEGRVAGLKEGQTQDWVQALNKLSDAEMRQLIGTNRTAKSILASNVKKKVTEETAKVKAEYEAKLKAKLSLSGQTGKASPSPATKPRTSASSAGTGTLATPQTNAAIAASVLLKPTTTESLKSSGVKVTYPFDRPASVPPGRSLPSQSLGADSSFGPMSTSSNIVGSSDTLVKNPFPSTTNRAQSLPFEKPQTAATNGFGAGSPFQPSNTAQITAISATVSSSLNSVKAATHVFGSPGLSHSSNMSQAPFFSASATPFGTASPNSISIKRTKNPFVSIISSNAPLRSNAFGLFAQNLVESKASTVAITSKSSSAPKDHPMSTSLIGNEAPRFESSGQKRAREGNLDRDEGDLKKGRVDETKVEKD